MISCFGPSTVPDLLTYLPLLFIPFKNLLLDGRLFVQDKVAEKVHFSQVKRPFGELVCCVIPGYCDSEEGFNYLILIWKPEDLYTG